MRLDACSIGLLAVLAACGTAQVIQKDQTSGVIQLEGDRSKAMEQANKLMMQHCAGRDVIIVSDIDEAVGQNTTRDAMKRRVHYECGRSQQQPAGPSASSSP